MLFGDNLTRCDLIKQTYNTKRESVCLRTSRHCSSANLQHNTSTEAFDTYLHTVDSPTPAVLNSTTAIAIPSCPSRDDGDDDGDGDSGDGDGADGDGAGVDGDGADGDGEGTGIWMSLERSRTAMRSGDVAIHGHSCLASIPHLK